MVIPDTAGRECESSSSLNESCAARCIHCTWNDDLYIISCIRGRHMLRDISFYFFLYAVSDMASFTRIRIRLDPNLILYSSASFFFLLLVLSSILSSGVSFRRNWLLFFSLDYSLLLKKYIYIKVFVIYIHIPTVYMYIFFYYTQQWEKCYSVQQLVPSLFKWPNGLIVWHSRRYSTRYYIKNL